MGMYDFKDIHVARKSEQIRAWAVEQSMDYANARTTMGVIGSQAEVVSLAKMIEDYISNGDVGGVITEAVEEGVREGRFEVLEVVKREEAPIYAEKLQEIFEENEWFYQKDQE